MLNSFSCLFYCTATNHSLNKKIVHLYSNQFIVLNSLNWSEILNCEAYFKTVKTVKILIERNRKI